MKKTLVFLVCLLALISGRALGAEAVALKFQSASVKKTVIVTTPVNCEAEIKQTLWQNLAEVWVSVSCDDDESVSIKHSIFDLNQATTLNGYAIMIQVPNGYTFSSKTTEEGSTRVSVRRLEENERLPQAQKAKNPMRAVTWFVWKRIETKIKAKLPTYPSA